MMLMLAVLVHGAMGQQDTLMGPVPRMWSAPPPNMVLVEAGLHLEHSARLERTSWLVAGASLLAGVVFWAGDNVGARDVCWGLGAGGWVVWQVGSVGPKKAAGGQLRQGWRPDRLYEALPDSVGHAPPVRVGRNGGK